MEKNRIIQTLYAVAVLLWAVPGHASEMDDRIEASFENTYVFKTYLKGENVKATSTEGAVILTGSVAEESHKSLAQETAGGLPGVKSIDNQLTVRAADTDQYSDTWIGAKVKAALLLYRNVSGLNTQVEAKEGVVTLRGEAASQAQKDLTTEYALDVEGVKGVKNEMTIASAAQTREPRPTLGEKIDDASIGAQAKMALLYHRAIDGLSTKVNVSDGVVTLTGQAKDGAEKDLASKIVREIKGVKAVVNNMTIGSAS